MSNIEIEEWPFSAIEYYNGYFYDMINDKNLRFNLCNDDGNITIYWHDDIIPENNEIIEREIIMKFNEQFD